MSEASPWVVGPACAGVTVRPECPAVALALRIPRLEGRSNLDVFPHQPFAEGGLSDGLLGIGLDVIQGAMN